MANRKTPKGSKRTRKPTEKAAQANPRQTAHEASLSPENLPPPPAHSGPTPTPSLPIRQLNPLLSPEAPDMLPNPFAAQLEAARLELQQVQAHENTMLRDRDELFRLQQEINELRSRQQSTPTVTHQFPPSVQQPLPQTQQPPLLTEYHVSVTPSSEVRCRAYAGQMQGKCRANVGQSYPSMRVIADRVIHTKTQSHCLDARDTSKVMKMLLR